jgi:hypothetical protein
VKAVRPKGDVASDRLLDAVLVAAVVIVLVGWATTLVYLGFHLL